MESEKSGSAGCRHGHGDTGYRGVADSGGGKGGLLGQGTFCDQ